MNQVAEETKKAVGVAGIIVFVTKNVNEAAALQLLLGGSITVQLRQTEQAVLDFLNGCDKQKILILLNCDLLKDGSKPFIKKLKSLWDYPLIAYLPKPQKSLEAAKMIANGANNVLEGPILNEEKTMQIIAETWESFDGQILL